MTVSFANRSCSEVPCATNEACAQDIESPAASLRPPTYAIIRVGEMFPSQERDLRRLNTDLSEERSPVIKSSPAFSTSAQPHDVFA